MLGLKGHFLLKIRSWLKVLQSCQTAPDHWKTVVSLALFGPSTKKLELYLPPADVRVCRRPGEALPPAWTVPPVSMVETVSWFECCWCWSSHCLRWHIELCQLMCHSPNPHGPFCSFCALFCQGQNWIFQQTHAPRHTSRTRRTWLQDPGLRVASSILRHEPHWNPVMDYQQACFKV